MAKRTALFCNKTRQKGRTKVILKPYYVYLTYNMVIRHILKVYHGILGIHVDIRPILVVGLDISIVRVLWSPGNKAISQ